VLRVARWVDTDSLNRYNADMVTLDSIVRVREGVLCTEVGGEAVLLNLESGQYYGLDEVGTSMWSLLNQHEHLETVCRALLEEYEVTEEQVQQDLLGLIDELASQGLVRVDGGQDHAA
jgi:hypothetical protein